MPRNDARSRRASSLRTQSARTAPRLRLEPLEARLLLAGEFRTIDGTGNNEQQPDWGSAGIPLLRAGSTAEYADGVSQPAGAERPSPRAISNAVLAQSRSRPSSQFLTTFVFQWGQFLDHDLDLTESATPVEAFPIAVPSGDPFFDPAGTGTQTIGLNRSAFDPATGTGLGNPREQVNAITAWIDASNVYGSDAVRAAALRTFTGGHLKTSPGNLLPFNIDNLPNAGPLGPNGFLAGDVRANEQVGLAAMHTLFVREHNRLADEIAAADPGLSDEDVYQRARAIVGAQMQVITYHEFLPALLGPDALPAYTGYDATVDPGIRNIFSTAAYRVGHTMLPSRLLRLDNDGFPLAAGHLALRDAFFAPQQLIDQGGIDPLLKGLATQVQQEIDARVVDEVRNFLFGPPGAGGFDLASLNIQRGRDHGLADYNQTRIDLGLAPVERIRDITDDPRVRRGLRRTYGGVHDIDLWVGGLAESHRPGSNVGELIHTVLVDQFRRLRDGDRFWYQTQFTGAELAEIESTTLADIIRRNTALTSIQDDVFHAPVPIDMDPAQVGNALNVVRTRSVMFVIRTTNFFDASLVDPATVTWANAAPAHTRLEDVDGDGDLDLRLRFRLRHTSVRETYMRLLAADMADGSLDDLSQTAELTFAGALRDGTPFRDFELVDLFLTGQERVEELRHG
jgi:hypothetical protein